MSRSVLFLSYLFPPRAGAGVQRSLKFAKYLPVYGWKPLVIANGGTAEDGVTREQDDGLLKDLGAEAVVRYTQLTAGEQSLKRRMARPWRRRLEPTDSMGWWVGPAVRTAMELYREHGPSAIVVTMSPFTAAEAGIRLKRLTGLPLVLDLRDPWALDETKIYPTRWHAWRDWRAMARALNEASLVVMNTPAAADWARNRFDVPASTRFVSITNGFDPDDYAHAAPIAAAPADVLRIVHTGMFHSELAGYWDALFARRGLTSRLKHARRPINLWTRTPRYLLQAIEKLVAGGRVRAERIELVLVGELTAGDKALVEQSAVRSSVRMLGYRSHDESVGWVKSADLLFLPLHSPLDGGPALIVPGKTYEYVGSGRPVLAMGPPGDMRDIVAATGGVAVGGDDATSAAEALEKAWRAKLAGEVFVKPGPEPVERYSRRALAEMLARELDETVTLATGHCGAGLSRDATEGCRLKPAPQEAPA